MENDVQICGVLGEDGKFEKFSLRLALGSEGYSRARLILPKYVIDGKIRLDLFSLEMNGQKQVFLGLYGSGWIAD